MFSNVNGPKNKAWIVFASESARMAPSAWPLKRLGSAAVWALAGDPVSELSFLLARRGQREARPHYKMPKEAILVFPIVVVEGQLFEAHFDSKLDDVCLEPRKGIRCHWRGAASWDFHVTMSLH